MIELQCSKVTNSNCRVTNFFQILILSNASQISYKAQSLLSLWASWIRRIRARSRISRQASFRFYCSRYFKRQSNVKSDLHRLSFPTISIHPFLCFNRSFILSIFSRTFSIKNFSWVASNVNSSFSFCSPSSHKRCKVNLTNIRHWYDHKTSNK